jgi:membrane fusion protein (multidrug efflux system)
MNARLVKKTSLFARRDVTVAVLFSVVVLALTAAGAARAAGAETGRDPACYTRQDLAARSNGFLTKVLVADGAQVKAGTVIAELDSRLHNAALREAKAAVAAANANVDLAKDTHQRLKQLAASQTVAPQELFNSEIHVRQAEAQVEQAKANLDKARAMLDDTKIKAEIDGRVSGLPMV